MPAYRSALEFAGQLLDELGCSTDVTGKADHPALAWRRAGLLPSCGQAKAPPLVPPAPLAASADGAILALKALADDPGNLPANGALLLGERARLMGLTRFGRSSTGGHCRLLDVNDGRIALNLARIDDWDLMEAWLGEAADSWQVVEKLVLRRSGADLVEHGVELGLPIALDQIEDSKPWLAETRFAASVSTEQKPLIVDLSSLWAGPLVGNLLHLMDAEVIKVESATRPDGAREGNREFFDLLNTGKKSVKLDFGSEEGRVKLKSLISAADIVIEASRPRAMRQLGIEAEELVRQKPGKVWLRLVAYGDNENRVGFGDDIGVSAGLCMLMEQVWGEPCFVGDAIADPISGLYAALAAWAKWQQGGGVLIQLSMVDIVRHAAQLSDRMANPDIDAGEWQAMAEADTEPPYFMRATVNEAEELGKSTAEILARLC